MGTHSQVESVVAGGPAEMVAHSEQHTKVHRKNNVELTRAGWVGTQPSATLVDQTGSIGWT